MSPDVKLLSVAICTYNRASLLPRAFRSVVNQTCSPEWFELLIIDNNSKDETPRVAEKLIRDAGMGTYYSEPKQGLSFAKNRALQVARGDAVMFLDDDAELDPDYVKNVQRVLEEEENVGVVGGPVELSWLIPVPEWYEPFCDEWFSRLYIASYRMEIHYPFILYGSNMVFPLNIIHDIGGFDTSLGRTGEALSGCEDGEVILRIERELKKRVIWEPSMKIKHLMFEEKVSREFLIEKAAGYSRSRCILEKRYPHSGGPLRPLMILINLYLRALLRLQKSVLERKVITSSCVSYLKTWLGWKR